MIEDRVPPRTALMVVAAVAVFGLVLSSALVLRGQREAETLSPSLERRRPAVALTSDGDRPAPDITVPATSPRLHGALLWLQGLATGLISYSDVTTRLRHQEPQLARSVLAAWRALQPSVRATS